LQGICRLLRLLVAALLASIFTFLEPIRSVTNASYLLLFIFELDAVFSKKKRPR
jgi:hypothetical protein